MSPVTTRKAQMCFRKLAGEKASLFSQIISSSPVKKLLPRRPVTSADHSERLPCDPRRWEDAQSVDLTASDVLERTLILPLRMAGPSSASRRTKRSILYSRPPRMLKPKPFALFSSSTVKKSKSCDSWDARGSGAIRVAAIWNNKRTTTERVRGQRSATQNLFNISCECCSTVTTI